AGGTRISRRAETHGSFVTSRSIRTKQFDAGINGGPAQLSRPPFVTVVRQSRDNWPISVPKRVSSCHTIVGLILRPVPTGYELSRNLDIGRSPGHETRPGRQTARVSPRHRIRPPLHRGRFH